VLLLCLLLAARRGLVFAYATWRGCEGLQRLRETEAELAVQRERNQCLEKDHALTSTALASAEARLATLEQQAAEVSALLTSHASHRLTRRAPPASRPPPTILRTVEGGWRADAANHVDTVGAWGARACRMSRTGRTSWRSASSRCRCAFGGDSSARVAQGCRALSCEACAAEGSWAVIKQLMRQSERERKRARGRSGEIGLTVERSCCRWSRVRCALRH